ncbi:MAG: beta-N-acetylhexosaminidase [Candidatus Binatia bacterium]
MGDGIRTTSGPLIMIGIPGPELDSGMRRLLQRYSIGGVILFRRNVRDLESLAALTAEIHAANAERPPLVAIDHEGGRVSRLDEPFTKFPPAAVIGAAGSPHFAYREGVAMGEELRAVGIDINFAPVLDVNSNPRNPVIGDRSFGAHPKTVSRMGISLAHGLQRTGMIPCGKHFPGHGDTDVDSHLDLPVVNKSLSDMERVELFPFRRAIQAGLDALMTAHVVFRALDPAHPATLSYRVMTELLRERLRFRGVVFSDDLEMKAISDRFGVEESAIQAIEAGADWLLFCQTPEKAVTAIEAIDRMASRRARLRDRIAEAGARIDQLRRGHERKLRRPAQPIPPEGFERHRNLVTWIEERAKSRAVARA